MKLTKILLLHEASTRGNYGVKHVEGLKQLDRMIKTSRKWSKYPLKDDPSDLSIALSNNKSTMNLTKETMFENKNISAFGKKTNRLFKGFISSAEIEQHDPDGYKRFMKSKFPYQEFEKLKENNQKRNMVKELK